MRRRFVLSVAASDIIALVLAMMVASALIFDTPQIWSADTEPAGSNILPLLGLMLGGAVVSSYITQRMRAYDVPQPSYGRAISIVTSTVLITALGIVLGRTYWSRPFLAITASVWVLGALAHRAARRRRPWMETMALVTSEKGLADDLLAAPHANILELHDPEGEPPSQPLPPGSTLVVDLRSVLSDRMAQFVSSSNMAGYPVRSLGKVYEEHTGRLALVHLAEGWEISAPLSRNVSYAPFKRLADILLVLITAPLWVPLGALLWLAVRLDSKGPVIYSQRRVGYRGQPFTLYKFRTMLDEPGADAPRFAAKGDERLTSVGKVLRRYRVDEIPQLWNVLKGDLSLVGPRPEQEAFVDEFTEKIPFYDYRHLVRPGVTGWAQVNYGYADDEADTIEKLTYDLYYLKHMSPWIDSRILGKSIWTVLSGFEAQ